MRLDKLLSDMGAGTRNALKKDIRNGLVKVNGETVYQAGMIVDEKTAVITYGDQPIHYRQHFYFMMNKPAGVVCTTAEFPGEYNIVRMVNYPTRIYPIGRLDKDSEGLILMTNQGELADKIAHARGRHEKEYLVTVDKAVTAEFVEQMRAGVRIGSTVTRPCQVTKVSRSRFRIVLTQGLNRQIRRMCDELGYKVVSLKRVRVMTVKLSDYDLKPSTYHKLDESEILKLYKAAGIQL